MNNRFFIVDVFAQDKFTGNQLAVFTKGEKFSDEEMQILTKEINFSETTFIFPESSCDNIFKVRIFTPGFEVPFAGHPTLGTAYVIQKYLLEKKCDRIILNLKAGKIPVDISYNGHEIDILTMKQNQPEFGEIINPETMKEILNTDEIDTDFPVQNVSTGLNFTMVPLKSLHAIKNINVNGEKFPEFLKEYNIVGLHLFTRETYNSENQLNARNIDYFGYIVEDPATGSANGCLLAYLLKYNYFNSSKIKIKVEQGFEIGRNAILYLNGEKKTDNYDIFVGGRVFPVAECNLI